MIVFCWSGKNNFCHFPFNTATHGTSRNTFSWIETISINDDDKYYIIKQLNNYFKTTDETKLLKEQIEILKTKDFLNEYWHFGYHHGNKELNFKIFKAKAAH